MFLVWQRAADILGTKALFMKDRGVVSVVLSGKSSDIPYIYFF